MQPDGPLPDELDRARLAASHLAGTNPITGEANDPDPEVALPAGASEAPPPSVVARAAPARPSPDATAATRSVAVAAGLGAVAGVVGTLAMSLLMLPAQWAGLLGTQPPRRVSDRLLVGAADEDAGEERRRVGTAFAHLGIGAAAGALLGATRALTARRGPAPLVGGAFGAALWAVNYVLVAPVLRFFPPPWRDRPGRPPVMAAANMVFGVVTAAVADLLTRRHRA